MPDPNKIKKAKEIGLRVVATCGSCIWGKFHGAHWGTCNKHTYFHQKHQRSHGFPAHLSMVCDEWEQGYEDRMVLGEYRKMFTEEDEG